MTIVKCPEGPLVSLLSSHPGVRLAAERCAPGRIEIDQDGWKRTLRIADPSVEVAGLVELMDNNPMVCGDEVSVPGPVGTLALIAFGPLIRAGLLVEAPVMQVAGAPVDETVDAFLGRFDWADGCAVSYGEEDFGGVVAANCVAVVRTPSDWSEIDDLYRESYAHSFYVREESEREWDTSLVKGRDYACYRLGYSPGDETSLLTVQVMADKDGKCGAAQAVHALNVMCGFEECEGVGGVD